MMTYTKRRPSRRPDFRERLAEAGRKLAYRLDHPRFLEDMVKPEEDAAEDGAAGGRVCRTPNRS